MSEREGKSGPERDQFQTIEVSGPIRLVVEQNFYDQFPFAEAIDEAVAAIGDPSTDMPE